MAFTACQKDNTGPENKITDTQLTPQQVQLKKGMQQAAIVIAQIANNKDIQKEVQDLINRGMYNDDYIKFKDLFYPQSNPKLKSTTTTLFARTFKKVVNSGNYKHLKSSDVSDLEKFLVDNNLVLYVPYPVSDYPENMRTPTVTWNPLDNDSVGKGYAISKFKSTNSLETVPTVNESYSESHPVYIINPAMVDAGDGSGESGSGDSGVGNGNGSATSYTIKLVDMRINEQLDAFYNGASEIQFVFADGFVVDKDNRIVKDNPHISTVYKFKRRMIRKEQWKNINITLDPDWGQEETENYFGAVELDVLGTVTLNATVGVKYKIGSNYVTASTSAKYSFKSQNDFIGEREFTRDYFFASQTNLSLEGHGTYNGNVIRPNGSAMDFTTKIIEY